MEFDCSGQNNARCLQNKVDCPTKSLCICPACYYGQLCQFNTKGFHSSLDGILGYYILPNAHFINQPSIVKTSFALTIIFCLITFKNKAVREFASACLGMNQWLSASVAVERTMMTIKGAEFNRNRSVKAVKFVFIILLIIIASSYVLDPIYRRVIKEDNDFDDIKRTWCIVKYSPNIQIYTYIIHIIHIVGPFLINLLSVIILFKVKAQQQSTIHSKRTYTQLLAEQFQELKHLIIAPIALVILTLPRLIMIFLLKCMESSNDAWFYLIGYFISFIPLILIFIIFILPSKFYKVEFKKTVRQYQKTIRKRLYRNSYE